MSAEPSSTAEYHLGRLTGKVALVTGGGNTGGFGAAIAKRFFAEGCSVLIADLDGKGAESVASSLSSSSASHKNKAMGLQMDVTTEEGWKSAVDTLHSEFGKLDVIVNNAGTTYKNKPTGEVSEAEYMRCFDVNVKSIFWSVKIAVPVIQKQKSGGSMINISSIGSIRPRPGLVWYNSSKGAVSNVSPGLDVARVIQRMLTRSGYQRSGGGVWT